MLNVVAVIVVLGGLIFFHELGHFLVARALGVGVKAFSLGFGPRLFGFRGGKTDYKVSLVPLGGYVNLVGEKEEADLPEGFSVKESFALRPTWHRILIVAAGPLSNIIVALLLCFILFWAYGKNGILSVVGEVVPDSPAEVSGIKAGDRIVEAGGRKVKLWHEFSEVVQKSQSAPIDIMMERDGALFLFKVRPELRVNKNIFGEEIMTPMIGVAASGQVINMPAGLGESLWLGVNRTWDMVSLTVQAIVKLLNRAIPLDNVGGPVLIVQLISQQSEEGLASVLALAAFISVNLGLLNLLPIPVLDGGHILFMIIETIRGRPVSTRVQAVTMRIGLAALLALFILAMYNDIIRIFYTE